MSTNDTRRRILDAAAALYREGGLAALSTDALARAAGTSKRSLYEHFDGRDAIIEAVLLARLGRHEADLALAIAEPGPVAARLSRLGELTVAVAADFPPGFWGELLRAAPSVAERVRARRDEIGDASLARLLEEGVATGEVRTDVPVPLLVAVARTLAEHLLSQVPPAGHSPLALAAAGAAVILDGVRGPGGSYGG